ncbi:MAG: ATP-binding cassette domain-containing protein [Candidatus Marinimicrobia bacterium]|nr:ATP-binding cassette domain-containing protein [Candidatus Neomarinimicrobiota bacterium]MBT4360185.1 ATP-binding cassette domain-containing protein [Candidatus Neomarinimicrobiota bacterium]MBT4713684.1 ATP-binding cassette domain-containing protein [Candidatus Neomarinimicrobiota bacterium]MBT4947538.1 ATP-binding cassette domain-containing protein [Candidatus Neomarinimicrobiota bacterium]MBT5269067.1 ATP-binding cassette domain-containing protein [Candidatus Neomarinimicrobiota bacterium
MIDVQNVTKSYGAFEAVKDVSFSVEQGEILGFLGPNGAGKTTMMKMITCYMPPTGGTITVDGMDVLTESMGVRKKIGYLPESTPLYEEMGVRDYLNFIADVRRVQGADRTRAMDRVISVTGLSKVIHKDIHELSKGYRQRVGFAQAIIHDPEILVLDEPTTGLDPNQIIEIRNLIRELGESKTVIFSTHIMQEVQATSDRVLIIDQGKIAAQGTAEELKASIAGQMHLDMVLRNADKSKFIEVVNGIEHIHLEDIKLQKNGDIETALKIDAGTDLREQLFDLAVSNQWKILESSPSSFTLEDVFRKLTN